MANSKTFFLRLPEDLHAQLLEVRQRTGMPVSRWVRRVLREALAPMERPDCAADALRVLAAARRGR